MGRYDQTKISKIKNLLSYRTTLYNKVAETNDDMYFIAQEGDRCDNLAFRFYGDPSLWWFIARVNDLKTMNVPAGTSLRIPSNLDNASGN